LIDSSNKKELDDLQETLRDLRELLRRVQDADASAMPGPASGGAAASGAHLDALRALLDTLHPADVAYVLEALPLAERLIVWDLVKAERDGEILLEVSDAVRETLIESMDSEELVAATEQLDTDEIADLAPDLPEGVLEDVFQSLSVEERGQLRAALSYPEDSVGALMAFDMVSVRGDVTLEVVTRYLRRLDELPDHTDLLFVVDRAQRLIGALPISKLIVTDLDVTVSAAMSTDVVKLHPDDRAQEAAQSFERYDLVSAAVVDHAGRLIGRVTVNAVVDYIRERTEAEQLAQAGLREEEDIFSSVWDSLKNRWAWLAINLVTAIVASRVIGAFEGSIQKLVALAALMPIVAGIGGNSGNQTITMIVRSIALGQMQNARILFTKEIGVAMLNGLIWGGILGLFAYWLYRNAALGLVMTAAMTLNLVLAAVMGVAIPLIMNNLGRDPALGSSVMITAVTDSGGFFIFLGLATLFLL